MIKWAGFPTPRTIKIFHRHCSRNLGCAGEWSGPISWSRALWSSKVSSFNFLSYGSLESIGDGSFDRDLETTHAGCCVWLWRNPCIILWCDANGVWSSRFRFAV